MLLDARALPTVAALGVDAVHDWACVSYGRGRWRFDRGGARRRRRGAAVVTAVAVARPILNVTLSLFLQNHIRGASRFARAFAWPGTASSARS